MAHYCLGFVYLGAIPGTYVLLATSPGGDALIVTHCAMVWGGDTLAYFIGKSFGKRPTITGFKP